jgi:hypothetical protein
MTGKELATAERAADMARAAFTAKLPAVLAKLKAMVGPACTNEVAQTLFVRLEDWHARLGVTLGDVQEACRRFVAPDVLGRVNYANQVLSELSALVAAAAAAREKRQEMAANRAIPYNPDGRAQVLDLLRGVTSGVKGDSRGEDEKGQAQGQGRQAEGPGQAGRAEPVADARLPRSV